MRPKSIPSPQQAKIRLLIADDHPVVRQGVIANVKPQRDMTVVAEASDGEEAISLIKKHLPDVVLLDLRMPRRD
ncbi:MAG TPA: response regulator transcription factor, partial [Candidatus Cybelea sp.]|nr:response regulator transcription factor [Candidatus Cybelea sp.]